MFRRTACLVLGGLIAMAPALVAQSAPSEARPGVRMGGKVEDLGLPAQGYQVYMVGELHGIEETRDFLLQYLALLHQASGLRDVALEEKGVYEDLAQAYVEGRSGTLPEPLCLRVDILGRIRAFNAGLPAAERIRVHFTDVDSPAAAIRRHLIALRERIPGARKVSIPAAGRIKEDGLQAVARLRNFQLDARTRSQLRTVEYSIRAYQDGFEVGVGQAKGSPYLDNREQAVASNIEDLVRTPGIGSLLVLYGNDHMSKAMRPDGGPARNQPFAPTALRLEQAGVRVFSIQTLPLEGNTFWRGRAIPVYYTAKEGHLASGETFEQLLAGSPQARFIYLDPQRQHAHLPTQDANKFVEDAVVLFSSGTPMANHCPLPARRP